MPRLALIVAALVAVLPFAVPAPAAAKNTPCWKQLINDWYDGRIDATYPVHCYREAIERLPPDAQDYSSASEDIQRALLAAIRDMRSGGGKDRGPVQAVDNPGRDPLSALSGADEDRSQGFFREVLEKLGPKNADSVPIPLLVLAGIAFLLLGAAAASYLARWLQNRRLQVAPAPAPPGRKHP